MTNLINKMQGNSDALPKQMAPRSAKSPIALYLLWSLLMLFAVARLLELLSGGVPSSTIVVCEVLPAAVFAFLHGRLTFGLRAILLFITLCLVVGSFFESLSLRTGFPFGHYTFTGVMGPQVFRLPVLLVLAYIGMGYASWVLGLAILGRTGRPLSGKELISLPLLSSFIMVAWDLAMDPVWANVAGAWVWRDGGPYFGVPVSNFLGWYLTVCCIYSLFVLYPGSRDLPRGAPGLGRLPILFYAITATSNVLFALPAFGAHRRPPVVTDPAGHLWVVRDILSACVLISLCCMLPWALLAWVRLSDQR